MADAVTSEVLVDGPRNAVMVFTNTSDGTGEAAVTKVDVSALSGSPSRVRIDRIDYAMAGMGVSVLWDAATDDLAWHLPTSGEGSVSFKDVGGLQNPQSSGFTGDIKFTTVGHASADHYSITLHMTKKPA